MTDRQRILALLEEPGLDPIDPTTQQLADTIMVEVRAAQSQILREAAESWAADPDAWGDNEKDYRNELRDRADRLAV